jgi:hypothetical protein
MSATAAIAEETAPAEWPWVYSMIEDIAPQESLGDFA